VLQYLSLNYRVALNFRTLELQGLSDAWETNQVGTWR